MTFKPMEIALAGTAVLALLIGAFLGYRRWRRVKAERKRIQAIGAIGYDMIRDVLLPDGNEGQIHVDFLLLTASGFLVIDLRDIPGVIFGGEQMDEWAVMNGSLRSTFQNPLGQLYDRLAVVRQVAGNRVPVEGRIVFTARGSFPKGRPKRVVILESLREEFPPVDRAQEPSPAAVWAEEWARLREAATPSPIVARR
jgi:hypothetical protein